MQPEPYDAIVIGSGFGGAMAAHVLVEAGWSVLMLERGDWVARGRHNWVPDGVGPLTAHYSTASPYHLSGAAGEATVGAFHCVGGPSVSVSHGRLATWAAIHSVCRSRSITRRVRLAPPAWLAARVTALPAL